MSSNPASKRVAAAALRLAMSESREEEHQLRRHFGEEGIRTAAVDYGGEFVSAVKKIIERAVVAAKREGVIRDSHPEEGR
ncbi:HutP protein [Heliophilum fasciatum]|uniref:Hut operon positive regulatory protein n=1 Tax=Heliophilum fasciatum TaxID=35700 RepID=A0A4R2RMC3_9FIRM|nr:hypothetical protein [Heliophilum fasciatum]TCP63809.1 HutP protein [Heliophilum fasciatum]